MVSRQKRIIGKVRKFSGRGNKLGFPTANLNLHKKIPEGVYLCIVKINFKTAGPRTRGLYQALAFIGNPKTFNDPIKRVEVHIPDLNKNLYNQWISVKLIKKIRANKKFKNKQTLIKQIKKDINVFRNSSILTTNH